MTFTHVYALHFLWLIPIAVLMILVAEKRKKRALKRYADKPFLTRLLEKGRKAPALWPSILTLLAFALMVIALSGPRWGSRDRDVMRKDVDIVLIVDVSPSMFVADLKPNRLAKAKQAIFHFLNISHGARFGLIAFSGTASIRCPLTSDYSAIKMFVQELGRDSIAVQGTDIGIAIDTGVSLFDPVSTADKWVFLITDGEDQKGKALEAARNAAGKGIRILALGTGDLHGGPVSNAGAAGGFKRYSDGNLVISRLDEEGLKMIAQAGNGRYETLFRGNTDRNRIYSDGTKPWIKAEIMKDGKLTTQKERFWLFLLSAFLSLILEGMISTRRKWKDRS